MLGRAFKGRSLQIRMMKDTPGATSEVVTIDPEELARVSKDLITFAAIHGVAAYSAVKLVDTISKIAVIAAQSRL